MSKIIMFIFCIASINAGENQDISFKYGFLGQLKSNPDSTVELGDKSIVHTGDAVRINIGYVKDSYFYLIYLDSEGLYSMHLPENPADGNRLDTLYTTILQGRLSGSTGNETFYLLNRNTPLAELTTLLSRYESAPRRGRIKLGKKIQTQLDVLDPDVKADLSSIASRLDKPLVGGVAFRGKDEDDLKVGSLTHECNGSAGIAFKKIVLDHK